MITILVILGIILILAFALVQIFNRFALNRNTVKDGWSNIDVALKKRYDLIPNLVETVKGYASHEKETLEQVINARNHAVNAQSMDEKMQAEGEVSGVLSRLFALSEAYPDLKANQQFLDLQNQLQKVEEDIAQSRKYYNGTVRQYNTRVESFPNNIVAGMFKFEKRQSFE